MAHLVRANTCPAAFAGAAARVRAAVDATTDQLLGAISKAIGSDPSSFASALFNAMKSPNSTVISNQSRFPLYRNDFGWGAPAWVSPLPVFYANFVSFLPPPPSMDGYCVYMTLDAHVLRRVAQNDLWRAHARLLH
ncbi:hypothetical protein H4R18_001115 [Coemansia javaensis]|uniref:Uncharacterized protein n=1 Tax=Coemansia javaensis TaxID=2761396 RepID=A0A9W8HET8_9FUNG|nr:hypothetical protein H4R18_001115 [Coemansia javaensis]